MNYTKCGGPQNETEKNCQKKDMSVEHIASENVPQKKSHNALWIILICIALAVVAACVLLFILHPWKRGMMSVSPAEESVTTAAPKTLEEMHDNVKPMETPLPTFLDEARDDIKKKEASNPVEDTIIGTWKLCDAEDEGSKELVKEMLSLGVEVIFIFDEDGTGSLISIQGTEKEVENFTYVLENGQIVVQGSGADYRIEDGMLHINVSGVIMIFKRS